MMNRVAKRTLAFVLMLALLVPACIMSAIAEGTTSASLTLGVKEKFQIVGSAIEGAEGKTLIYRTSNKKIATVSSSGVITAKRKGTVKIGVGYSSGGTDKLLAVCTVTVKAAPKKIYLSEKSVIVNVGSTLALTATLPENTASAITFTSSDTSVATVDDTGKVKGVATGKAIITAQTFNGKKAKCTVYVMTGEEPTTLSLNATTLTLQVKETFQLKPTVNAGSQALYSYASSNKKIATVSSDGLIKAKKKGTVTIAVKTHNGLAETVNVIVRGKLKEVYGYLTKKPKTFAKYAKRLKLTLDTTGDDANTVMYYNDHIAYTMTANSCQIDLHTETDPVYSIHGVDGSMTYDQAASKLVAKGWSLAETKTVDGVENRVYTKGGDSTHTITITSNDGSELLGLTATLTW